MMTLFWILVAAIVVWWLFARAPAWVGGGRGDNGRAGAGGRGPRADEGGTTLYVPGTPGARGGNDKDGAERR